MARYITTAILMIWNPSFANRCRQWYYDLGCKIEAVYLSASTQYTLIYNSE